MSGYRVAVRRVLFTVLAANLAVVLVKAYAAWRTGSLAIASDSLHSLVDAANNVAGLLIVHFATAPPDDDHPYGHHRYETLAAFVVAGFLVLTAFELARLAVGRLVDGAPAPVLDPLSLGLVIATGLTSLAVAFFEGRAGRRLGSDMVVADAAHTASDVGVSAAVVVGYVASANGWAWADAVVTLLVAGVIAVVGYSIFKRSVPVLTDRVVFDPDVVAALVREVPGVVNVHDIRSRGHAREAYVQMHLVVASRDVEEAHAITEAVERHLETKLGAKEVLVHVEPWDDSARA